MIGRWLTQVRVANSNELFSLTRYVSVWICPFKSLISSHNCPCLSSCDLGIREPSIRPFSMQSNEQSNCYSGCYRWIWLSVNVVLRVCEACGPFTPMRPFLSAIHGFWSFSGGFGITSSLSAKYINALDNPWPTWVAVYLALFFLQTVLSHR